MKRTEIKRKTPLTAKTPLKPGGRVRGKAKPKGRRGRLEKETEKRCMAAYRGVPCILCAFRGIINRDRTCGHHIVPKSRCRAGRFDPANIVPLCQKDHKFSNEMAPHSSNPLAVARFDRHLEKHMPKRFAATRKLDERAKQGPPYKIDEVERDYDFWRVIADEERPYKVMCSMAGVEAYAVKLEGEV